MAAWKWQSSLFSWCYQYTKSGVATLLLVSETFSWNVTWLSLKCVTVTYWYTSTKARKFRALQTVFSIPFWLKKKKKNLERGELKQAHCELLGWYQSSFTKNKSLPFSYLLPASYFGIFRTGSIFVIEFNDSQPTKLLAKRGWQTS